MNNLRQYQLFTSRPLISTSEQQDNVDKLVEIMNLFIEFTGFYNVIESGFINRFDAYHVGENPVISPINLGYQIICYCHPLELTSELINSAHQVMNDLLVINDWSNKVVYHVTPLLRKELTHFKIPAGLQCAVLFVE